jgi:hypothetical protein
MSAIVHHVIRCEACGKVVMEAKVAFDFETATGWFCGTAACIAQRSAAK